MYNETKKQNKMKNKLEPLSDRWNEIMFKSPITNVVLMVEKYNDYVNFTGQNLSERYEVNGVNAHPLNRFVPCDLEGNVLAEPEQYIGALELDYGKDHGEALKYQQALERVVFEGFEYLELNNAGMTIIKYNRNSRTFGFMNNQMMSRTYMGILKTIDDLIHDHLNTENKYLTLTATGLILSGKK